MFDITKISDKDLCETGRRLQQAHDRIESRGFDIWHYSPALPHGPCCYIGSVKLSGGLKREWSGLPSDNPRRSEVRYALELLDRVSGGSTRRAHMPPGMKAERIGFSECFGDKRMQAETALPVFRRAIREVQMEMERRA